MLQEPPKKAKKALVFPDFGKRVSDFFARRHTLALLVDLYGKLIQNF